MQICIKSILGTFEPIKRVFEVEQLTETNLFLLHLLSWRPREELFHVKKSQLLSILYSHSIYLVLANHTIAADFIAIGHINLIQVLYYSTPVASVENHSLCRKKRSNSRASSGSLCCFSFVWLLLAALKIRSSMLILMLQVGSIRTRTLSKPLVRFPPSSVKK